MGSQPNLASRSEVVSIYKCPPEISGPSPKFGAQKTEFWITFSVTSALDTTYLRNETSHRQTKMQSTMCLLKVDLLSVTFDPGITVPVPFGYRLPVRNVSCDWSTVFVFRRAH